MRPTVRCVLLFAAGFPVALMPVLMSPQLWTLWFGYLGAVVMLTGLDAVLSLPRRRLVTEVEAPELLFIGDRDPLVVTLSTRGWRWKAALELLVDLDVELETLPVRPVEIPSGGVTRVELPLVPRRRGLLAVDSVWLRWVGPFGLLRRTTRTSVGKRISVVPNTRAVRVAALRFFSNREFLAGLKVEQYEGDGSEFDALREYMPGLDHRAINWKASAKHRKLLCTEFRAERNHQVVIAVDSGQLMAEPVDNVPKLDHAINAGLLLSYFGLRTGDRVGLYGFDEKVRCFAEPRGGMAAFSRLQKLSAELEYRHAETNFTLGIAELAVRLRRRSLVVLLTDFVDTISAELMLDNVMRLATRHVVVFVALRDPSLAEHVEAAPRVLTDVHASVVASDFLREREVVLQRLRQRGVHCIDAIPSQVSIGLLNRYLDIKRRELV